MSWRGQATLLFERWKWRPSDVESLRVSDFIAWYESCLEIAEAEAAAIAGS